MFAAAYFAKTYFAGTYFPPASAAPEPPVTPPVPDPVSAGGGGGGWQFNARAWRLERDEKEIAEIATILAAIGVMNDEAG